MSRMRKPDVVDVGVVAAPVEVRDLPHLGVADGDDLVDAIHVHAPAP